MAHGKGPTPQSGYRRRALLAFTIAGALGPDEKSQSWEARVKNAAVNAWFEGHIEAENQQRGFVDSPSEDSDDALGKPPFPRTDETKLYDLIDAALAAYPGQPYLAAVRAAADGWAAGYREGLTCPGCRYRGSHPKWRRRMERGEVEIRFDDRGSTEDTGAPKKDEAAWRELISEESSEELQQAFVNSYAARKRKHEAAGKNYVEAHGHALMDALAVCLRSFGVLTAWATSDSDETDQQWAETFRGWVGDVASTVAHEARAMREAGRQIEGEVDEDDYEDGPECPKCERPRSRPEQWSGLYEEILKAFSKAATGQTKLQSEATVYAIMASGVGPAVLRPRTERVRQTLMNEDGSERREILMPCDCDYAYFDEEYARYMKMSPAARKSAWKDLGRKVS